MSSGRRDYSVGDVGDDSVVIQGENIQFYNQRADRSVSLLPTIPSLVRRRFVQLRHVDEAIAERLLTVLVREDCAPQAAIRELLLSVPTWVRTSTPLVWAFLGEFALAYGDVHNAVDLFARAAREGAPQRTLWMVRAALAAAQMQDLERSRQLAREAYDLDQDDSLARLTQVLVHSEDYGQIVVTFAYARAADTGGFPVRVYLAQALRFLDRLDEGITELRGELALDPQLTGVMITLAEFLLRRSERERGVARDAAIREAAALARQARDLRRSWRLSSGEAVDWMIQASIAAGDLSVITLLAQTQAEGGEATPEEACFPPVAMSLGMWAVDQELPALALSVAERLPVGSFQRLVIEGSVATRLHDDDPLASALLTQALHAARDPIQKVMAWRALAKTVTWPIPGWEEFHRIAPADAEFCESISLITRGHFQDAINRLRPSALASRHHAERLAEAYEGMGRVDEAVEALRAAGRIFRDPELPARAVLILARARRDDDAIGAARSTIAELYSGSPTVRRMRRVLAELFWRQHDWVGAAQQAEAYLADVPGDQDVGWMLVGALFNQKQYDQAWDQIDRSRLTPRELHEAVLWLELAPRFSDQAAWIDQALEFLQRYPGSPELGQAFLEAPLRREGPSLSAEVLELAQAATSRVVDGLERAGVGKLIKADPAGLEEINAVLSQGAEEYARLAAQVAAGVAPVGVLSTVSGRSACEVWVKGEPRSLLISSAFDQVRSADRDAVRRRLEGRIVVDVSSLAVLSLLPALWEHVLARFMTVTIPSGTRDDIVRGRDSLALPVTQFMTWDVERRQPVVHDIPDSLSAEWRARSEWMAEHALTLRIVERKMLSRFRQATFERFSGWLAAIDLAVELGDALYCDDLLVRIVARSMGVETFGTVELMAVLVELQLLSDDDRRAGVEMLRGQRCVDLPFEVSRLTALAESEGWQPGVAWLQLTRPAFWANGSALQLFTAVASALQGKNAQLLPVWLQGALEGACQALPLETIAEVCALITADVIRLYGDRTVVPALVETAKTTCARLGGQPDHVLPSLGQQLRAQLLQTVDYKTAALLFANWMADVEIETRSHVSAAFFR